jgi:D-alanine-D-alanine ligase
MDKDTMKRLFASAKLPIVKWVTFLRGEWEKSPKKIRARVEAALKYPVFVKPANLGSSVGISKAHEASELPAAMNEAARFDRKIIIEQSVGGKRHKAREIECAVLGNDEPVASICGEIIPCKEFYDYNAKYIESGSELVIPARLDHTQVRQIQEMAIRAFQSVECSGLARVDFLMDPVSGHFYLNEVNTMPGFTAISMYPKLWAATGIEYPALIDRLIQLALERYADKKRSQFTKD